MQSLNMTVQQAMGVLLISTDDRDKYLSKL